MNSAWQAVMGVSSLAFDDTEEKLTVLHFGVMERRSFGRRRWHVLVSQQWQIAEAVSIDEKKFETLVVPLTRAPVPMLSTKAEATKHGLFNVNAVKA